MPLKVSTDAEWLEADGLGGFSSGTVGGIRTRRYHALLLAATTPPTGRVVLVSGCDVRVETPAGSFPLSSQRYLPDVIHPDGMQRLKSFESDPWPRWSFTLEDGLEIEQELFVRHGAPIVLLSWRLRKPRSQVTLSVRPFLAARDYHALHHENIMFRFDAEQRGGRVVWRPYEGMPGILAFSNGQYVHRPDWYRNFFYTEERARGLDCVEDLGSPGLFFWDLSKTEAVWILSVEGQEAGLLPSVLPADKCLQKLRAAEQRRRQFPSRLHRSADAYLVRRGAGQTILAGYPWFTDWGRDTFVALRGLCLTTGRIEEAREILLAWGAMVSDGMLPNRFPDRGEAPEFNSVDASLWYIIAIHDYFRAVAMQKRWVPPRDQRRLRDAVDAILTGYAKGTRYGIRLDDDGLLAAGVQGLQLTWMDAKIGDWVVTPRIGKPVEVQALWLNALHIGGMFAPRWAEVFEHGCKSFRRKFWNEAGGYLYDVIDCDHQAGTADARFRPNQIFAVGGFPLVLLEETPARRMLDAVEARLWTPLGLRSLAREEPEYVPKVEGDARARDSAYHQGAVWPWLIGPFVEAWIRVRRGTQTARRQARTRYLQPLLHHLNGPGLGHLCEIADGDPPHTPRGCPFQAWSLGEVLRLSLDVLNTGVTSSSARSR